MIIGLISGDRQGSEETIASVSGILETDMDLVEDMGKGRSGESEGKRKKWGRIEG